MKILVILLLIIFPFGQLLRINLGNSVVFHLNDFVVGIFFIFALFKTKHNQLLKPVLFWFGAMLISLIFNIGHYSTTQIAVSSLYALRWMAYAGLFFTLSDFKNKKLISNGLKWGILTVAVLGVCQYIFLPDVTFLAAQDWDNHYFRLISTYLDPGFTGSILTLGLFSSFNPLGFIALVFTYSRASYLMYIAGFAALAFYKKSLKIFISACLVLVVTVLLLPKTYGEGTKLARESSTVARIENWKKSIEVWRRSPIYGIGFDSYRYATKSSEGSHSGAGADSSILLVLATTGIFGLFAYLNLLKNMWSLAGKNYLFKVCFVGVLVHSWFNNTLFYPWVMEYLWLMLVL